MKHTVGQKGFSVVEVVVVLAMVAVLAVGGFFVWQKNKDDSAKKSDAKTSQSEEEPSDPSEGGKYLVIEEWAIKLPLNDDIAEAYYTFSSDDLADASNHTKGRTSERTGQSRRNRRNVSGDRPGRIGPRVN